MPHSPRSCALAALLVSLLTGCTLPSPEGPAKKYEAPDERFVFFTGSKNEVLVDGYFSIGYVAALLDADPALRLVVVGHADPHGKPDANRELSLRRARIVRKALIDHGVKAERVVVAAPREQTESSLTQLSRRADLFVYHPAHEDAGKRVGYPLDVQTE